MCDMFDWKAGLWILGSNVADLSEPSAKGRESFTLSPGSQKPFLFALMLLTHPCAVWPVKEIALRMPAPSGRETVRTA